MDDRITLAARHVDRLELGPGILLFST
jgi:hypothetical protein